MKNRKMVILVIVLLTTIVAGCNTAELSPTPTISAKTIMPTPVITVIPTVNGDKACPTVSNLDSKTLLPISATDITFAIDESISFSKLDKNNRYKITKFLLKIFHELFQQIDVTANFRVDYLLTGEQKMVGTPIPSTDTEKVQNLFDQLDEKIKNPMSNLGNFSSHDEYIESFVNERNIVTSMGNRVMFYFTDGTFFLNEDREPNSYTFQIMDKFSQQMENISNSPDRSDKVIVFLYTKFETMRPAARTYWQGINTLEGVDVIWFTPENLESILRTAVSSVLGEENAISTGSMNYAEYGTNSKTSSESTALEGWRVVRTKNGEEDCNLDIPPLPYNVSRESSKILDLTIEYDEGIVENVPWIDDVQNYDDCTSFTIPHPAEELLCKEPAGMYFFWWKTEEFSLGLDNSDEGNFAPICNGVNDPTAGAAVFKVDITKPGTIGWDKIQPCFVPQLEFTGMEEAFPAVINNDGNAIFSIDQTQLETLLGEVEYTVSFRGKNCNTRIGESITNDALFVHYPVSGEVVTLEKDGLTIKVPLRFYEPSSNYPAIVTFKGKDGDALCDLTSEYSFTLSNEAYGFITNQAENLLSIEFMEGFIGPARKACNEMQISWQTDRKNKDYWEKIRISCGDVKATVLEYSLIWDETENRLVSVEEMQP